MKTIHSRAIQYFHISIPVLGCPIISAKRHQKELDESVLALKVNANKDLKTERT